MARRKKVKATEDFYSSEKIDRYDCVYKLIIGLRSNGKTYCIKKKIIDRLATEQDFQFVYIRRNYVHTVIPKMNILFDDIADYCIETLGDTISYCKEGFYLTHDKDKKIIGFALNLEKYDDYRGIAYPNVKLVFFDEFMSKTRYLINEVTNFLNLLSTVLRLDRKDFQIFMVANTVNEICPYFDLFKFDVRKMRKGHVYYVEHKNGVRAVLEWCRDSNKVKKGTSAYLGFDDTKETAMMVNGDWETDNLNISEIDGIKWNYKDRELIPMYVTGVGYVFELSYTTSEDYPVVFVRRVNTQYGKVNENIQFNLALDNMSLRTNTRLVPTFGRLSPLMGKSFLNMMTMFDECLKCGRVLYNDPLDGTRFLNIYDEIMAR